MRFFWISILAGGLALTLDVAEAAIPSGYVAVARAEHVPADILYAIACAESGRRMADGAIRPWPWTLNVGGVGRWYPNRAAAYESLLQAVGERPSIDIGLGQINWYWHRDRLVTPWRALDPYFNLQTTARLLRDQFKRCRCDDWWTAVERYHAPSDSSAARQRRARYREGVQRCWQANSDTH